MNINRAVTAGLVGGTTIDLFLIIVRAVPFPGVYQFIASALVGPVAFSSSTYIALGLFLHFFISVAFAATYEFVAERYRALIDSPLLWGSVFGIAVMIVMQILTGIAHVSQPPTAIGIIMGLVAHIVFFGIPVALYVARTGKRRALTT